MLAIDQIKRFERWRRLLPKETAYLVDLALGEVVPLFLARGFDRFHDYAGGSTFAVGPNCIPLQRREGVDWPTVEILFHKRRAPILGVHFGWLPEVCYRLVIASDTWVRILRAEVGLVEGPALFSLCKGTRKNLDCNFGYRWWALRPKSKIRSEVDMLKLLLPMLFNLLDRGLPAVWMEHPDGYVDRHVFMTRSLRLRSQQQSIAK
jgi:hypothetical protein